MVRKNSVVSLDYDVYTDEELLQMSKKEACKGLNEREQRFCEYYIHSYSLKSAVVKSGIAKDVEGELVIALKRDPNIKRYIQWLKAKVLNTSLIKANEILEQWAKIAFSDITDVVDIGRYSIRVKPGAEIDGQVVKSIKHGRDGLTVEMYDKLKALEQLAKYTADMPSDWRRGIEESRLELQQKEFELKKQLYDSELEKEDDGFIEALKQSTSVIYSDEDE